MEHTWTRIIEGQEFKFLSCPLPPICPITDIVLQSNTIQLKLSCPIPYFFSRSNAPYETMRKTKFIYLWKLQL